MIAVDWGTSSFRAYRLDTAGKVLERREAAAGILTVRDGAFGATLLAQIGDWLGAGESSVVMSGMIGSRQGWQEAPYASTPAGADEIAMAMITAAFDGQADVRIAPGVQIDALWQVSHFGGDYTAQARQQGWISPTA